MPLKIAETRKDSKGKTHTTLAALEWKYLDDGNRKCPGCGETVYAGERGVEYCKTKRGTHVFWHTGCTGKVWH